MSKQTKAPKKAAKKTAKKAPAKAAKKTAKKAPAKAAKKVASKAPAEVVKKATTPQVDASLPTGLLAQDRLAVKRDFAAQIKACTNPSQRTALRRELQRTIKGK